jgi:uncharacterized protein
LSAHWCAPGSSGTAETIIWSCTEGKFNWCYDLDETIMILEGAIVLQGEGAPPKRYGVGDVIYFRKGAHAKWHVEGYVKAVAVSRLDPPTIHDPLFPALWSTETRHSDRDKINREFNAGLAVQLSE